MLSPYTSTPTLPIQCPVKGSKQPLKRAREDPSSDDEESEIYPAPTKEKRAVSARERRARAAKDANIDESEIDQSPKPPKKSKAGGGSSGINSEAKKQTDDQSTYQEEINFDIDKYSSRWRERWPS
ncbi:hypothetical protein CTA1_12877 [Colletotrichum tanaceti]|uniref:Uncharacterized protein n=1 Tax=Colletotrichum tanaceti TaxID=1306861 RepID=A0A4U6XFF5_9PEZI|nr:hypothetical protein CTA1_12877 [Colletotrichum tanaceti]